MPRFYFDVRDDQKFSRDEIGTKLPGLEEARDQAAQTLGEIARFALPGADRREMAIEIRDEHKAAVLRTRLLFEAVRLA